MKKIELRVLLALVSAAVCVGLACGVDRYPCDDPGAQNSDPDTGGGYADPDCVGTSGG